jgi:hypothetical protein
MTARLTVLAAVLFCILTTRAAAQCPADFLDAGELSASTGPGRYQEITVTKDLLLPKGIRIDSSYRQKFIQAAGDGAASDMRAVQIPAGIHLIPGGRTGGGWWSIDNPKLETVDDRFRFKIDLYANSGTRGAAPARGGGQAVPDVRVRVCVKVER